MFPLDDTHVALSVPCQSTERSEILIEIIVVENIRFLCENEHFLVNAFLSVTRTCDVNC